MLYPASEKVRSHSSKFEVAHLEARRKRFSGSLVLEADSGDGIAVYLRGMPVYAYAEYGDGTREYGDRAVDTLCLREGSIDRRTSEEEDVEMFCTYMEYLGKDKPLIYVYEKQKVNILERDLIVMRDEGLSKVNVPEGTRVGYSFSEKFASRYFEEENADGYALSNDAVVRFRDGHKRGGDHMKNDGEPILAKMESEQGLREHDCEFVDVIPEHSTHGGGANRVNVEFDIEGWEIVRTDLKKKEENEGLISSLLGD